MNDYFLNFITRSSMRYFYHERWRWQSQRQLPSNRIIEIVSEERYNRVLELERGILERNPHLDFWHEPFKSETIPEGKQLV